MRGGVVEKTPNYLLMLFLKNDLFCYEASFGSNPEENLITTRITNNAKEILWNRLPIIPNQMSSTAVFTPSSEWAETI